MRWGGRAYARRFNHGKKVFPTLDEQRAAAVEKLLTGKQETKPKYAPPTKEEMFAQVGTRKDLVQIIHMLVGGDVHRISRVLTILDEFADFRGLPIPSYYASRPVLSLPESETIAAAKKRIRLFANRDRPRKTADQYILVVSRDINGNLITKKYLRDELPPELREAAED